MPRNVRYAPGYVDFVRFSTFLALQVDFFLTDMKSLENSERLLSRFSRLLSFGVKIIDEAIFFDE